MKEKYFTCEDCRKDFLKRLNKFEREKGSRCIENSILFEISDWNKFKEKKQ